MSGVISPNPRAPAFLAALLTVFPAGLALWTFAGTQLARRPVWLVFADDSNPISVLAEDKGKFRILVNGQVVGKEEFEIVPSATEWVARGTTEIQSAKGSATRVTGTLQLTAGAAPVSYEWSTEGAKKAAASIHFQNNTATIELRLEASRPYTQQFTFSSPRVAILDNNLYHQYSILARLYDWEKKGPQTIAVLVPQEMTPGSVTVESVGPQTVGASKLEELRVRSEDLEVHLFLDGRRLVRIAVPSTNAEVVRE